MAASTAPAQARKAERQVQVLTSSTRARQEVAIGRTTHQTVVGRPERSFSYTQY